MHLGRQGQNEGWVLFNRYRVSVSEDEKSSGDVKVLNATELYILNFFFNFICLFLAVLGLCCWVFIVVQGFLQLW